MFKGLYTRLFISALALEFAHAVSMKPVQATADQELQTVLGKRVAALKDVDSEIAAKAKRLEQHLHSQNQDAERIQSALRERFSFLGATVPRQPTTVETLLNVYLKAGFEKNASDEAIAAAGVSIVVAEFQAGNFDRLIGSSVNQPHAASSSSSSAAADIADTSDNPPIRAQTRFWVSFDALQQELGLSLDSNLVSQLSHAYDMILESFQRACLDIADSWMVQANIPLANALEFENQLNTSGFSGDVGALHPQPNFDAIRNLFQPDGFYSTFKRWIIPKILQAHNFSSDDLNVLALESALENVLEGIYQTFLVKYLKVEEMHHSFI